MEHHTLRQLRGATDLITDAVEGAATAVAGTQMAIARKPYGLLAQVRPIARPVRMIEHAQVTITVGVFHALLATNRVVRAASVRMMDRLEGQIHP